MKQTKKETNDSKKERREREKKKGIEIECGEVACSPEKAEDDAAYHK